MGWDSANGRQTFYSREEVPKEMASQHQTQPGEQGGVDLEAIRRIRDSQNRGNKVLEGALKKIQTNGDDQVLQSSTLTEIQAAHKTFQDNQKELDAALKQAEQKRAAGA